MNNQKWYKCPDCGKKLIKGEENYAKRYNSGRCSSCNHMIFINVKTGRRFDVDPNISGNPILLLNGKTFVLKPDNYVVTNKYGKEFWITSSDASYFKDNEIFMPQADFSIALLKKIIRRLDKK